MECIKKSLKRKNERISKLLKQIRVIKEEVSNLRKDAKKGAVSKETLKKAMRHCCFFKLRIDSNDAKIMAIPFENRDIRRPVASGARKPVKFEGL